eukprot:11184669-Alexandrium_andersonii.AAC.1
MRGSGPGSESAKRREDPAAGAAPKAIAVGFRGGLARLADMGGRGERGWLALSSASFRSVGRTP